jgi:hypothetical protein
MTRHRADVDNMTLASPLPHISGGFPGANAEGKDVNLQHVPPGFGVAIQQGLLVAQPGVVDQHVYAAPALADGPKEREDVGLLA